MVFSKTKYIIFFKFICFKYFIDGFYKLYFFFISIKCTSNFILDVHKLEENVIMSDEEILVKYFGGKLFWNKIIKSRWS